MGERLLCKQEVIGSIPFTSTTRPWRVVCCGSGNGVIAGAARRRIEFRQPLRGLELVGQGGFEPPTSRLSSARSNQLSY